MIAPLPRPSDRPELAPAAPPTVSVDQLGDRIAELSAHLQAATYRLLVLIREFDERDGWCAQGASTCAHWLSWRTGLDLGAAREKVRVARALADLPRIAAAMEQGEISYSKVRALTRVATAENEEELLAFARAGTAAHVERLIRAWRRVDRLEEAEIAERRRSQRYFRSYVDEDGMLVVRARLEPEAGAMLLKALDVAEDKMFRAAGGDDSAECSAGDSARDSAKDSARNSASTVPTPEADPCQRRADAMALLAESALGRGLRESEATTGGDHHQVVVHVDAEALPEGSEEGQAVLEGGTNVSAETSRRLACDSSKVEMRHARDGTTLDVGRKTRTVPPAIRRALAFRDRHCRFPGCGARICDAHHVEHWADGGATRLSNLVLLCRHHHRAVHEGGFKVLLHRDGAVEFFAPGGRKIEEVPAAAEVPTRAVDTLRSENVDRGIEIDAETGLPSWRGGPVDVGWAVQALRSVGPEGRRVSSVRGTLPR